MAKKRKTDRQDNLWAHADLIQEGLENGLYIPILRRLALAGHVDGMVTLANCLPDAGKISEGFSRSGLLYRAFKRGSSTAAQNLAMDAFNRGYMQGYRLWLGRSARLGDKDSALELRRFETRLPHGDARAIGRRRPYRAYDFE
jgi:hypothetical protein